jgi:hypothetical protein
MQSMWQTANTLINEWSASKLSLPNVLAVNNRRNAINQSLAFNFVTEIAAWARGMFNLLMDHEKMPKLLLLLPGAALYFLPFNQPRLKIAAYHVII